MSLNSAEVQGHIQGGVAVVHSPPPKKKGEQYNNTNVGLGELGTKKEELH